MLKWLITFLSVVIILMPHKVVMSSELDDLNRQIQEKQEQMKKIEAQVEVYKKNIEQKQNETVTLANQLSILQSRLAKTELDIRIAEVQIDQLNLEISSLNIVIKEKQVVVEKQRDILAQLIKNLNIHDQKNYLGVILGSQSFSDYFNQIQYLEDINHDLSQTLRKIRTEKEQLQLKQDIAVKKKDLVEKLKKTLEERQVSLEENKLAKDYLLVQTKSSENKFKLLLAQLRQEYSQFDQEVATLQRQIEKKIAAAEELGTGPLALSWPVDPSPGITAYFHDPTYPFRYLFEHPGIDVRAKQGTPIEATASGYVAWVRSSRLYGNNVMIVHREGLATLYAHLSQIAAKEDTFIKRGDIIGLSGGMPGTPGAGFSTGPHLHFEVRDNGLPVDPLGYLIR